jgi:hypothetical protein
MSSISVELVIWGIGVASALATAWLHDRRDRRVDREEAERLRRVIDSRLASLERDVEEMDRQLSSFIERTERAKVK